jgi:hypothetical protein
MTKNKTKKAILIKKLKLLLSLAFPATLALAIAV